MATMQEIEKQAAKLAAARDILTAEWLAEKEELAEVERKHLASIRRFTATFSVAHENLTKLIAESPGLFEKPKSVILHGVKLGYRKGSGKIEWDDDDAVIKLIRKHCPDLVDVLIQKKEKPLKGPLGELPADILKKLGITVEDTADVAFAALADGDSQKMIKALLKKQTEEVEG
jgi:hypothetical protein